jgi:hypothetical protein
MISSGRNSQPTNHMQQISNPAADGWLMYGSQIGAPLQRRYGKHSLFDLSLWCGLPPIQTRSVVVVWHTEEFERLLVVDVDVTMPSLPLAFIRDSVENLWNLDPLFYDEEAQAAWRGICADLAKSGDWWNQIESEAYESPI